MYTIYWTCAIGQVWKTVPESEVKTLMDALDRLGFPVDKVEMP